MNGRVNARQVRVMLLIVMLLILAGAIGGFLLIQNNLSKYASVISNLNADAQSGDQNLIVLKKLEDQLKDNNNEVANAKSLVADAASYGDKVVEDISTIASESGVTVTGFQFIDTSAGAAAVTAPATPPTAPGSAPATVIPPGITKKTVTLNIKSPLSYTNLMNFLSKLETNELRLQPTSVSMTKDVGNNVGSQMFTIEVYVRKETKS